jgi:ArsR family transcriptional regulator, arsenate/arsenite/antimonite-responsive transcriptional repressor
MNDHEMQRLERRAQILKSLAHPSRLLIIELLDKGPRCVADLIAAVGADKTTVSKHLPVLKKVGLVRDKKRGTWSDYELACGCVSHFVDCIEEGMRERSPGLTCAAETPLASSRCPLWPLDYRPRS